MRSLEIIRLESHPDDGTFGVMRIDKAVFCVTLEPPWRLNWVDLSSIPSGQYIMQPYHSARFGDTWQVMDVPARHRILFHAGNVLTDTNGCLLLGRRFGWLSGQRAILSSKDAMDEFITTLDGCAEAHLTIAERY